MKRKKRKIDTEELWNCLICMEPSGTVTSLILHTTPLYLLISLWLQQLLVGSHILQLLVLPTSNPKLCFKIAVECIFPNVLTQDLMLIHIRFSGPGYFSVFQDHFGFLFCIPLNWMQTSVDHKKTMNMLSGVELH